MQETEQPPKEEKIPPSGEDPLGVILRIAFIAVVGFWCFAAPRLLYPYWIFIAYGCICLEASLLGDIPKWWKKFLRWVQAAIVLGASVGLVIVATNQKIIPEWSKPFALIGIILTVMLIWYNTAKDKAGDQPTLGSGPLYGPEVEIENTEAPTLEDTVSMALGGDPDNDHDHHGGGDDDGDDDDDDND